MIHNTSVRPPDGFPLPCGLRLSNVRLSPRFNGERAPENSNVPLKTITQSSSESCEYASSPEPSPGSMTLMITWSRLADCGVSR
jgi:hypothetical protein